VGDAKTVAVSTIMGSLLALMTLLLGPQWAAATHLPGGVLVIPLTSVAVTTSLMLGARPGATLTLAIWAFLLAPTPAIGFAPGLHKLLPAIAAGLVDDALWPRLPEGRRALLLGGIHVAVMWAAVAATFAFFGLPAYAFMGSAVFLPLAAADVAAGSLASAAVCRGVRARIGRGGC